MFQQVQNLDQKISPVRMLVERLRRQDGSITMAVVVLIPVLLFATGLVLDGGRQMGAYAEARDLADNAARVGAQQVDLDVYRQTGQPALIAGEAEAAAAGYLASQGHTGTVVVNGDSITVTVTITSERYFLPGQTVVQGNETVEAESGIGGN